MGSSGCAQRTAGVFHEGLRFGMLTWEIALGVEELQRHVRCVWLLQQEEAG
jgi:hypothetical protein